MRERERERRGKRTKESDREKGEEDDVGRAETSERVKNRKWNRNRGMKKIDEIGLIDPK